MKLIILGTGTGNPSIDRASPSLLLYARSEITVLDMGPGTMRQLSRVGINHERIAQVFITHFHPDHTADLIHFLFATKDPSTLENRRPFTITGPQGLGTFIEALQRAYGKWIDVPSSIMLIEEMSIDTPEERHYKNFRVYARHTRHTPHSLAYRIEGPRGQTFVYSGDTEFCDELVSLAQDCDLLILECSFPDDQPVEGHMTPSEAGRVATLAGARKLLLVHFYPEALATDIANSCRKTYTGELILGRDLMHIVMAPDDGNDGHS
ncbi:MAG: MBL fold metallo-hydrolase [Deltaproteobacteria bacterium]|nr:MBL fold metallo-hydrolase [Deltaproteobacteria bacterium]MBW2136346.1 MBL fold metallo-hydrolase [Deltaproteobacteria bacterium]